MVTPTDIANRALQRCGASRIALGELLTEDSKNASEIRACYEILRRFELRRNVWRFSIRTVAIRAFDDDSQVVTFADYDEASSYAINDIITANDGQVYQSLAVTNIGFDPLTRPDKWTLYFGSMVAQEHDTTIAYWAGELVYVASAVYRSKISANEDTPPSTNWQTFTDAPTLSDANFVYPIGTGPISQANTKNAFQLPNGFLRMAAQDPKNGATSPLGAPTGVPYKDWLFESNYLLSQDTGPILLRFAADIADTRQFDPMFVEGLASRIAFEVCEPLTQSSTKLSDIGNEYQKFMTEARLVNGIEVGSTQPPIDDFISCRI